MIGKIHSIETFGSVDGPGIRFVIFLHGCPFRCAYCHNPDTWASENYQEISAQELIQKAKRYQSYWGKDGGITVSGGEPLLQIDFLIELFTEAKKENIHTCIDTSGACFSKHGEYFEKFKKLMKLTDLLLVDIKEMNDERHQRLTGMSNKHPLEMIEYLDSINKPIWIRHVLVPTITDFDEDLKELDLFIQELKCVEKVEILPYHTLGQYKWENLGLEYRLKGIDSPSKERIENAKTILHIGIDK